MCCNDDLLKNLTEEQKEKLLSAKSPEELKELIVQNDLEINDEELDKVSGGCFRPSANLGKPHNNTRKE